MHLLVRRGRSRLFVAVVGLALVVLLGASLGPVGISRGAPLAAAVVFSASGADPAAIQPTVDSYRSVLGTLNPNQTGSFGNGRREINWDGVPDVFSAPNAFPANFFNANSPRGAVFTTPGMGFQVSANASSGPIEFGNLNPTYPATFQTFSPQRLFTALGSNVLDVTFFVPGTTTPATVSGFGAVFTDVDTTGSTTIQYFDGSSTSLGTFVVPALSGSGNLSFLGVFFNAGERVGRVRITSGNAAIGPDDAPSAMDIVVMDDFIYGEPIGPTATPTITPTRTTTPTATRTPTSTPLPRPNVGVQVAPSAGTLQTTITARNAGCAGGDNQLISLHFTKLTNATVSVGTTPPTPVATTPTTVNLPTRPTTIGLTVQRVTAGQATTVELTVTDGCGTWPTFVGGGPSAF